MPDASLSMWPLLPCPGRDELDEFDELEEADDESVLCCGGRTTAVTMEVTWSNLERRRLQDVGSERNDIVSEIPPVRSDKPSSVLPYLSASYEPCNLNNRRTFRNDHHTSQYIQ